MALRRFCKKHDEGAIDISKNWVSSIRFEGQENMTKEELEIVRNIWCKTEGMYIQRYYENRVLSLGEHNGYHDSDFYAMVWDDETESVKKVVFASTRGWCYPCYPAEVDAPEDIRKKAEEYTRKQNRHYKAYCLWEDRKEDIKLARTMQLKHYNLVRKLKKASVDRFDSIFSLLKVKKFRSEFRKSMAQQVRSWVNDPAPKYDSPLSWKQWKYLY